MKYVYWLFSWLILPLIFYFKELAAQDSEIYVLGATLSCWIYFFILQIGVTAYASYLLPVSKMFSLFVCRLCGAVLSIFLPLEILFDTSMSVSDQNIFILPVLLLFLTDMKGISLDMMMKSRLGAGFGGSHNLDARLFFMNYPAKSILDPLGYHIIFLVCWVFLLS